ncbi:MAG: hypothetical protein AB7F40_06780 [Victivallaceae bacterium]|nr:hypothetical protein [Victivallaceae bacterium]
MSLNFINRLRGELANPDNRNKVIVLGALLIVCVVVFLLNTDFKDMLPDLRTYQLRQQEYDDLREQLADERAGLEEASRNTVRRNDVWVHEDRLAVLQRMLTVAKECNVNLARSESRKDVPLADGVSSYEFEVRTDPVELGAACKFVIALGMSQPRFFWDGITIKPAGGRVVLEGKLKALVVTGDEVLKRYWGND